jgi:hypothetical protein
MRASIISPPRSRRHVGPGSYTPASYVQSRLARRDRDERVLGVHGISRERVPEVALDSPTVHE